MRGSLKKTLIFTNWLGFGINPISDKLKEQIESGLSDEQIYNYWVVRYGERIITNPQRTNIEMIVIPILLISLFILAFIRSTKNE